MFDPKKNTFRPNIDQLLDNIHDKKHCEGRPCVVHHPMSTVYRDSMVRELNKLFEGYDLVAGHSMLVSTIYVEHKVAKVVFLRNLGNDVLGKHRAADEDDALDLLASLVSAIVREGRIDAEHPYMRFVLDLNEILVSKCETRA